MKRSRSKKLARIFKGEVIVPGIAIGKIHRFGTQLIEFPKYWIHEQEIKNEIKRFYKALESCKSQLEQIKSRLCSVQGSEQITILDSHGLLLQDELLVRNTLDTIKNYHINAEWALDKTLVEIKEAFNKIDHLYLKERKDDIDFIKHVMQCSLMGRQKEIFKEVPRDSIVFATQLSPAETLHLIRYRVCGLVTEHGNLNSHTAIVTRSLQIPSITGVEKLVDYMESGDEFIIDGYEGQVILNPQQTVKDKYIKKRKGQLRSQKIMQREAELEAQTLDGQSIQVLANLELLDEIDTVVESGAEGVGLYRTEFLFLDQKVFPGVEEQEKNYKGVLKRLQSHEVTIRTLDLGADKIKSDQKYLGQSNPALGLRAIRFCMQERQFFDQQLRALLAASVAGQLKICIPMISSVDEFRSVKKLIHEIIRDMKQKRIPVNDKVPIGVMIETPAAALEIDLLAKEADFFSVGTNDLIQYVLAVDRTNELVSYLYNPLHPSMIRLLKSIIDQASRFGKDVTLCGEMAADPLYLHVILAMGFKRLSMNAASIPRIKKMIRSSSLDQATQLLTKVLASSSCRDIQRIVQNQMQELFPEYF